MEKKNKKPLIFIALLFSLFLIVGGTIAYYTSSDTFNNEFNTRTYGVEAQEDFVSPDNWLPGTTTPKTVIATNKGSTPIAVRIKLTPSWEDANGDPLPLKDNNDNEAAIINFASDLNFRWVYQDGYYYYKRALNENQSTTSLLKSVTFNPNVNINNTSNCETVNGVTTCTTGLTDYAGGIYTLRVEIETAQYDKYEEIWGTDFEVKEPLLVDGTLIQHNNNTSTTFGKNISRDSFESITTVDNKDIPGSSIDSWDCSQQQNESVMCWYIDTDNDSKYELYIGQEDGVKANPNSSLVFYAFGNVEDIDLTYFDTSNTINMDSMFKFIGYNVATLELDLSGLDTSNVTNMSNMFSSAGYNSTTFNIGNLNNWDTSNVTTMHAMFSEAGRNATTWNIGDLSGWDVSKVTNMESLFYCAGYSITTFDIGDLSGWNTTSVTNMNSMFDHAGYKSTTFDIGNIGEWNTSKVTDMTAMFHQSGYRATTWNVGNLSNWRTSNVTNMTYMFKGAGYAATTWNVGNLNNWDTSNVTSMNEMFSEAGRSATTWNIGDLSGWNVSKVTDMEAMFFCAGYSTTTFDIGDLSGWNTSLVTKMGSMFNHAGYVSTTWNIGNLSSWNTSNVTDMSNMFQQAGYYSTTWNSIGTLKVYATNIKEMFSGVRSAKATLNIYSNPTSYSDAFQGASRTSGSGITVNYSSATTNIDDIVATKSSDSNVVKGSQLD